MCDCTNHVHSFLCFVSKKCTDFTRNTVNRNVDTGLNVPGTKVTDRDSK
jgi:hypothetical protein